MSALRVEIHTLKPLSIIIDAQTAISSNDWLHEHHAEKHMLPHTKVIWFCIKLCSSILY